MARSSSGGRGGLRTLALVAAVAIALASTAAVVLSDDPETLRLAVVGALWAFVLAAFAAPRRRESDASAGDPGTALELRRTYEIELEKEVAARREYELQLEVYLRRELERGLAEDVAALRDEVGRMRGDMIDRLDGELRMERIETTRLIGGSLRALQDEARRLGIGTAGPARAGRRLSAGPDRLRIRPRFGGVRLPGRSGRPRRAERPTGLLVTRRRRRLRSAAPGVRRRRRRPRRTAAARRPGVRRRAPGVRGPGVRRRPASPRTAPARRRTRRPISRSPGRARRCHRGRPAGAASAGRGRVGVTAPASRPRGR